MQHVKDKQPHFLNSVESSFALREKLVAASDILKQDKQLIDKKSELLKTFVKENLDSKMKLDAEGHTLPHMPNIKVTNFIPEKCFIFKSAVMPMRMAFEAKTYKDSY